MKEFGKKVLKYVIIAALAFVGGVILVTYFKEKTFGFNIKYVNHAWVFAITFFSVAGTLVYDLLKVMDGKGKKKSKNDIEKAKDSKGKDVDQYFDKDFVKILVNV